MRIRKVVLIVLLASAMPLFAASPSTSNDASCDISALPAATLLLPYFEVDVTAAYAKTTTVFSITNVTQQPQIARVTLWTDWSYPVVTFDVFLTGYDVQSIDLYDVIVKGRIAYESTYEEDDEGMRSLPHDANPLLDVARCGYLQLEIPPAIREDVRSALTTGLARGCGEYRVGGVHAERAVGYATIDVVKNCGQVMPLYPEYFTEEILYENVLIGDYQQIDRWDNFAQGGAMVHIRAIPEGGTSSGVATLPSTFYSRHQAGGTADRRQPLPALFAMRWIEGGSGAFSTRFKIWRDRAVDAGLCDFTANAKHASADVVRFDEDENPTVSTFECPSCWPQYTRPSTSWTTMSDATLFPPNAGGDVSGWMYVNLNDYEARPVPSQSWVTTTMLADGRYSTDVDATALGNGCTPEAVHWTNNEGDAPAIGPVPNDHDDSCDIAQLPAATLLLPYFEVDLRSPNRDSTLFTVVNVSRLTRIAHVTIWTDLAYPVFTFDIVLTGYDVQSISLFDLLSAGRIAGPRSIAEMEPGHRSAPNDADSRLDISSCAELPSAIPPSILADLRNALANGRVSACGLQSVGQKHPDFAIGYITIDVVRDCNTMLPSDPRYYTEHLLHDNVLTGDYQQIDPANNYAQGGPLVHIRAVPAAFPRTFYSRYQSGNPIDRRQPLPSTFAARWFDGGSADFNTSFKIWRELKTSSTTACAVSPGVYPVANAVDVVRFDDEENPTTFTPDVILTAPPPTEPWLPAASRVFAREYVHFPPNPDASIAGWLYLNLDLGWQFHQGAIASQNWVVVSMRTEGRFSIDFDAPALGNGCSPVAPITAEDGSEPVIGPPPN